MAEKKGTPAIVKKEGKKTSFFCGKNAAANKAAKEREEQKESVKTEGVNDV